MQLFKIEAYYISHLVVNHLVFKLFRNQTSCSQTSCIQTSCIRTSKHRMQKVDRQHFRERKQINETMLRPHPVTNTHTPPPIKLDVIRKEKAELES